MNVWRVYMSVWNNMQTRFTDENTETHLTSQTERQTGSWEKKRWRFIFVILFPVDPRNTH